MSNSQIWKERYEREKNFYKKVLEEDPFHNFDKQVIPESKAAEWFIHGLDIVYANPKTHMGEPYFKTCVKICDRLLGSKKLTSAKCKSLFPLNRGRVWRVHAFSRAMLTGDLAAEELTNAITDFDEWRRTSQSWDDQGQAMFLAIVRLMLILGKVEAARSLFKGARDASFHKEQQDALKRLCDVGANKLPLPISEWMESYFNQIRDPAYYPKVYSEIGHLRFEIGVIRDKYFISKSGKVNCQRAVAAIAE